MPCESAYLNPTDIELDHRRAAKLLVYVWQKQGKTTPEWLRKTAQDYYGEPDGDRAIRELCAELKSMDSRTFETVVYNAHSKTARDLADWWEDHQKADAEREAEARAEQARRAAKKSALKKLTLVEKKALGLKD